MAGEQEIEIYQQRLKFLTENLHTGGLIPIAKMLNSLYPAEIAKLLESLPPKPRKIIWNLVEPDLEGDVLTHLHEEVRSGLIEDMDPRHLLAAVEGLDHDDLADLLESFPKTVIEELLHSMDVQDRRRLEAVMSYSANSAGGLMNTDTMTIRPDVTLDVVQRYLRFHGNIPPMTDSLIVVSRNDKYLGTLPLVTLLTKSTDLTVAEVIDRSVQGIPAEQDALEVVRMFEERDLVSAAVIDADNTLLGRITIDDVVDVIRDEAEHSMMQKAGLSEHEDMFGPVVQSVRRRTPWLWVNLLTALLAAWVIGVFQGSIEKAVELAILMPVVASMGGIAGTQTLTLVIRGMALGEVGETNARWLMTKELAVGAINGVVWSLIIAGIAAIWFQKLYISLLVAMAILTNLLCAAIAGAAIPMLLKRYGADPALAGGVVLTTVTDTVGFFVLLGMAALIL